MAWHDEDSWLTAAFAPKLSTMAVTLLVAILLPILLHQFIYRKATPTSLPAFLLVGPSGAGKTALTTLVSALGLRLRLAAVPNACMAG
jgi:signal recognition particle receptor subunit beta